MESKIMMYFIAYLFTKINSIFCVKNCNLVAEVRFPNGRVAGRRLDGLGILNTTAETSLQCFAKCTENCQCKSVNVCGKSCQLNSGSQADINLNDRSNCNYFEVSWAQWNPNEGSTSACTTPVRCCNHGNPCLHGGKCVEQCPSSGRRYRCECQPGFTGKDCQHTPKSCRALYNMDPNLPSGKYTLYDGTGASYKAYCDFTIDSGKVWTLVMSYTFGNNPHYWKTPLLLDNARNENEANWDDYRLSKAHMATIQNDTTHWRITCNHNTQSITDQIDYLRVNNGAVNMLTYNADQVPVNERCIRVEYLNIRGTSCTDCTLALIQTSRWMLFTSKGRNQNSACDWQYPNGYSTCGGLTEENFGGYECYNSNFRCTASSSSTTQMWFGS